MASTVPTTHGRKRLIDAALNLSYHRRSFSSLGIREITREANLSAPAFYRHFSDLADLGTAVIWEVETAVIDAFKEVRISTANEADLDIRPMLVKRFFDWAVENPKPVVVGASEAFGSLERMRDGLKKTIRAVSEDICSDNRIATLLPGLPQEEMFEVLEVIAQNVLFMAVEYIEKPEQRPAIYDKTLRIVGVMFAGAHAIHALQIEQNNQRRPPIDTSEHTNI
ncbi:MAG: TetR family transcriptional regulator [Gammaproteobacteria bacterium]|uniref:TetR/AcrR family transcriptional regulator n=1 Tax=Limnobacter sp. TaxID=2003368 RepID=UPI001D69A2D2|nr:TetR/AcrR family transcriptional regulator [Limnobacter sp.]MBU0783668.1 TetR family transcriptional regulator [Gammaproteobacteria bacterium]MBU0850401.1 TetR family transcriptional regulator [Gammaproteobacteria bacterium]MBU1267510.1 TetR family transcriptional regulator [Gammaproteobacteria bacterium]MBU1529037.1 TetR family transcriptional regulator [Gammaproteobacteria bacterium]MBU1781738.1 TetR family transcriptional regulator [Gammaproteobacteria bacterium]